MTSFAALPGTSLVSLEANNPSYPVVGWLHTTGLNVVPLVVGHPGPLTAGEGVELENGSVIDLMTGVQFGDFDSWLEDFNENPGYRIGTPIKVLPAEPKPVEVVQVVNMPGRMPAAPDSGPLDFSGKVYAKASFWQAYTGGREVVFVLTPEHPSPLPPARKITRDAYFEARKTIAEVTLDSLMKPVDDQPRLPLGDETDEDDDGDDLI